MGSASGKSLEGSRDQRRDYAHPSILRAGSTIRRPMVSPPPIIRSAISRYSDLSKVGRRATRCVMVRPFAFHHITPETFDGCVKITSGDRFPFRIGHNAIAQTTPSGRLVPFAYNAQRSGWFPRFSATMQIFRWISRPISAPALRRPLRRGSFRARSNKDRGSLPPLRAHGGPSCATR
jgi:hypothetical protein